MRTAKLDPREAAFLELIAMLWELSSDAEEHVAAEANVSPSTLYAWKHGITVKPRIDTLARVARVLGYRVRIVLEPV